MNIIIVRACSVVLVPHAYQEVVLYLCLCYYYNKSLSIVSTDFTVFIIFSDDNTIVFDSNDDIPFDLDMSVSINRVNGQKIKEDLTR